MATQSQLSFRSFNISKVVLNRHVGISEGKFDVNINRLIQNHSNPRQGEEIFDLLFIASITSSKFPNFHIQIEAVGHFHILGTIDKTMRDNFMNISAPIIVYPFLRAFITNLTVNSGMKPVIIPAMNFH